MQTCRQHPCLPGTVYSASKRGTAPPPRGDRDAERGLGFSPVSRRPMRPPLASAFVVLPSGCVGEGSASIRKAALVHGGIYGQRAMTPPCAERRAAVVPSIHGAVEDFAVRLADKTAVVLGAATGTGRATALAAATPTAGSSTGTSQPGVRSRAAWSLPVRAAAALARGQDPPGCGRCLDDASR